MTKEEQHQWETDMHKQRHPLSKWATPILSIRKLVMDSKRAISGFRTGQVRQHILLNTVRLLPPLITPEQQIWRAMFEGGPSAPSPYLVNL